jgi:hypothetical protein
MPTRKQRRREAKSKRHDYEVVYVDEEGNEVEPAPEELEAAKAERPERRNGAKPAAAKKPTTRSGRTPPPPTWRRSFRRAGLLGIVVFFLFALGAKGTSGGYASAAGLAVLYTALFVPFTYAIDRFAYRRWEARQNGAGPSKRTESKKAEPRKR